MHPNEQDGDNIDDGFFYLLEDKHLSMHRLRVAKRLIQQHIDLLNRSGLNFNFNCNPRVV